MNVPLSGVAVVHMTVGLLHGGTFSGTGGKRVSGQGLFLACCAPWGSRCLTLG